MVELKKQEIIKALKEGKKIFLKGSNATEMRLYRFANGKLEYSDNNKDWNISNMLLEELEIRNWILFEE